MTNETRLLHKAIADRNLSPLFSRNITDNWFRDDNDRRLFQFLRKHFASYSECPSITAIKENFPNYDDQVVVDDKIEYLIDAVITNRRREATIKVVEQAIATLDKEGHEEALVAIQGGLAAIDQEGFSFSKDVDLTVNAEVRYQEYLDRKNRPDSMLGYATGFPSIDQTLSGIQKGQLIVLAALPKTGKSTLLMQMALNMHAEGHSILFASLEMTAFEQALRYDSMRSKLAYQRLSTGTMTSEEEARYLRNLKNLNDYEAGFHVINSESGRGFTLTNIANKIQTIQPDVVIIDGTYLMVDENGEKEGSPQAITNITRGSKRLAMSAEVPILMSTQFLESKTKGGKADMYSIGYSSSFGQDADVVFGLEKQDENISDMRTLKIMASRNSGPAEIELTFNWDSGTFREIDESDLNVD